MCLRQETGYSLAFFLLGPRQLRAETHRCLFCLNNDLPAHSPANILEIHLIIQIEFVFIDRREGDER